MMLYSTYNLLVSGVLFILISFIAIIQPDSWVVVVSSISCCAVTFSLCILFLPKVYRQYKKVKVVASELFTNASIKALQLQNIYKKQSGDDDLLKKIPPVICKDIQPFNTRLISVKYAEKEKSNQQSPSFDSGISSINRNSKFSTTSSSPMRSNTT